jgi:hypothetical protein
MDMNIIFELTNGQLWTFDLDLTAIENIIDWQLLQEHYDLPLKIKSVKIEMQ